MWENSHLVTMQIRGVGVSTANKLAQAGLRSFQELETSATSTIQRICGRRHPFGANIKSRSRKLVGKALRLSTEQSSLSEDKNCATFRIAVSSRFQSGETRREGSKKIKYKLLAWIATSEVRMHHSVDIYESNKTTLEIQVRSKLLLEMNVSTPTSILLDVSQDDLKPLKAKLQDKKTSSPLRGTKPRFVLKCKLLSESIVGIDDQTSTLVTFGEKIDTRDVQEVSTITPHDSKKKKRSFVDSKRSSSKCRHRCKDKRTCGHLCCREGLKNPRSAQRAAASKTLEQHFKRKRALDFSSPPQRVKSKTKQLSRFTLKNHEQSRYHERSRYRVEKPQQEVVSRSSSHSSVTNSTRKRSSTLSNALDFAAKSRHRFDARHRSPPPLPPSHSSSQYRSSSSTSSFSDSRNNHSNIYDTKKSTDTNTSSDFDDNIWSHFEEDTRNLSPYDFEMQSLIETSYSPSPPRKSRRDLSRRDSSRNSEYSFPETSYAHSPPRRDPSNNNAYSFPGYVPSPPRESRRDLSSYAFPETSSPPRKIRHDPSSTVSSYSVADMPYVPSPPRKIRRDPIGSFQEAPSPSRDIHRGSTSSYTVPYTNPSSSFTNNRQSYRPQQYRQSDFPKNNQSNKRDFYATTSQRKDTTTSNYDPRPVHNMEQKESQRPSLAFEFMNQFYDF